MAKQKKTYSFIGRISLSLFFITGISLIVYNSKKSFSSYLNRLPVEVVLKNGKKVLTYTEGIAGNTIRNIKRSFKGKSVKPMALKIYGKLFVENSDIFFWKINYTEPVSFFINENVVTKPSSFFKNVKIFLRKGLHDFKLELSIPYKRDLKIELLWKNSLKDKWKVIGTGDLFSASAQRYSFKQLIAIQKKIKIEKKIKIFLNYLFIILFLFTFSTYTRRKFSDIQIEQKQIKIESGNMKYKQNVSSRNVGIDITKGFAAFLMIAAHCPGGNTLLPFGNFGAALFFFCSGMNTMLFLEKTKKLKGMILYQLFFVLLLFFGGYTQIVIAHPDVKGFIPAFLQFNALAMLLLFILVKFLKNSRLAGYLFFFPFLLHFCYKLNWLPFLHSDASWRFFLFGKIGFPLFPWAGYLLYGVLVLYLHKKSKGLPILLTITGISSIFSILVLKIPVHRYNMSLSYILLGLFVLAFLFYIFNRVYLKVQSGFFKSVQDNIAMVGRNSLMFVYVHYCILRYLLPRVPEFSSIIELLFQALIVFVFCIFFIFIYEKIKHDYLLFFPAMVIIFFLFVSRYALLFPGDIELIIIDMIIGILFAFLYVQLRGKFRVVLKKT